uniref:Fic_N domain-containing protein n=1 Tax=Ascaris lumbricoides TaxID=6252 RepID=A0A0M3I0M9_ASCLU
MKLEKRNGSKIDTDGRRVAENPLSSVITKLEQLEVERALAASQQNKSLCSDIAENKNLIYPLRKSGLLVHTNGSEIGDAFTFILALKVAMIIPFQDGRTHLTRLIDFLMLMLKK